MTHSIFLSGIVQSRVRPNLSRLAHSAILSARSIEHSGLLPPTARPVGAKPYTRRRHTPICPPPQLEQSDVALASLEQTDGTSGVSRHRKVRRNRRSVCVVSSCPRQQALFRASAVSTSSQSHAVRPNACVWTTARGSSASRCGSVPSGTTWRCRTPSRAGRSWPYSNRPSRARQCRSCAGSMAPARRRSTSGAASSAAWMRR